MEDRKSADADVARAARHMIERHGIYAAYYAAMRAEDLRHGNNLRAARIWDDVAAAILVIRAAPPMADAPADAAIRRRAGR